MNTRTDIGWARSYLSAFNHLFLQLKEKDTVSYLCDYKIKALPIPTQLSSVIRPWWMTNVSPVYSFCQETIIICCLPHQPCLKSFCTCAQVYMVFLLTDLTQYQLIIGNDQLPRGVKRRNEKAIINLFSPSLFTLFPNFSLYGNGTASNECIHASMHPQHYEFITLWIPSIMKLEHYKLIPLWNHFIMHLQHYRTTRSSIHMYGSIPQWILRISDPYHYRFVG